ncbi:hypothetical protein GX831_03910 [bacterium]|jgi:ethanolamine transporter EutH|nr:hypothetical protein [bacterium]
MDIFSQVVIMLAGAFIINNLFRRFVKPLTSWVYWFIGFIVASFFTNIITLYLVSIGTLSETWGPTIVQTIAIGVILLFMPREPGKFGRKLDPSEEDDDSKPPTKKKKKPKY